MKLEVGMNVTEEMWPHISIGTKLQWAQTATSGKPSGTVYTVTRHSGDRAWLSYGGQSVDVQYTNKYGYIYELPSGLIAEPCDNPLKKLKEWLANE